MSNRNFMAFSSLLAILCTQIVACSATAGREENNLDASFELRGVLFKPGRPIEGEKLEISLNSTEFDQLFWLNSDIKSLKARPAFRVEIVGFADPLECEQWACYELSARRAKLVYEWLVDHGAPKRCLVGYKGRGAEDPLYDSGGEDVRQRNRRVEVTSLGVTQE